MRECPKNRKGSGSGGNRSESSITAPPDRATLRGATSGTCKGEKCLFAITSRQQKENSPYVITGMIKVFILIVYALVDPSTSLSFMTPYIAMNFVIFPRNFLCP